MAAVASLLPQPNLIRGWWLFCPLPCPRGWRWGLALSRQHCVARCPWQAGPRALQLIWWTQLTLSNSCHLKSFALVRSFHPIFWVIHQQCGLCLTLHPGNPRLWLSAAHHQGWSRNLPFCNLYLDPSALSAGRFDRLRGMVWITQPTTPQVQEKKWQ